MEFKLMTIAILFLMQIAINREDSTEESWNFMSIDYSKAT